MFGCLFRDGGDEDEDDEDSDEESSKKSKKDDRDDSIGKVIVVETNDKRKNAWFPALVCKQAWMLTVLLVTSKAM